MVKVIVPGSKKRPGELLEGGDQKKKKLDNGVRTECGKILRTLMTHSVICIRCFTRAARAAKEALLESAKSDLQLRREKEREKIEKMERTVIIGDNLTFLRELEKMCQYSGLKNPLEKIGLRLKKEYHHGYEYSDDDNGIISDELEDGEIF
uniref:Transcription factor GTE12-like n=1 Tax=Tanacetum cinerariifolium TaxID=118510 RepID=A0A699JEB3_TANCI|nr:transcription factor GTE12-like [Tanacetum cinerariifolium]